MGLLAQKDDGQKPLFRKYASRLKKEGTKVEDIREVVESIRLSGSEEWILIECENSVTMLHAESKVGESFWDLVTQFKGEMKALCVTFAKGKLGFDVEPHPTESGFWSYDAAEERVEYSDKEQKKSGMGLTGLTLEAMSITSSSVPKKNITKK